jgi:glutathione S-transferase
MRQGRWRMRAGGAERHVQSFGKEKNMKIYGVPLSVHTRKVLLAAKLKGIPYELQVAIPVAADTLPANWREISPTGLVPAIDDEGFRLADSTAIVSYLERKRPEVALLPEDDKEFATALFLDAWAGGALFRDVVQPIFHNQIVNPNMRKLPADSAAIDAAMSRAQEAFAYLEGRGPEDFLVGRNGLTIADLAVLSNLINFHYLGRRIDRRFPKLRAYFDRHIASRLFKEALREEIPFADQMGLDRSFIAAE